MTYEDLLRLYMVDEFELDLNEFYRIVRDWCATNGFNFMFVVNALSDDYMKIVRGEFLIEGQDGADTWRAPRKDIAC